MASALCIACSRFVHRSLNIMTSYKHTCVASRRKSEGDWTDEPMKVLRWKMRPNLLIVTPQQETETGRYNNPIDSELL
jgi:hypothetical protein